MGINPENKQLATDMPNLNPILENDLVKTAANTPITISLATLLANDTDPNDDDLLVTGVSQTSYGSLVNNNDGTYTYTPNTGYYGFDSFTYSVSDGQGGVSTATVNINVSQPYVVVDSLDDGYYIINKLTTVNNTLYISSFGQRDTTAIWRINQTTGNVEYVSGYGEITGGRLALINDTLYLASISRSTDQISSIYKLDNSTGKFVEIGGRIQASGDLVFFKTNYSFNESLKNVNGTFYLTTIGVDYSYESGNISLWKIDNTTKDFVLVIQQQDNIVDFDEVNGTLYVIGYNRSNGYNLSKIDNGTSTPVFVADISPGSGYNNQPYFLGSANDTLYLVLNDAIRGNELWKIDNSTGNPVLVADINVGIGSSNPSFVGKFNNTLYFVANGGNTGRELWKVDNSTGNPVLVADINPGVGSSNPSNLIQVNDKVYFIADNGNSGQELWQLDLTTNAVVQVKDINPGAGSSNPSNLTNINGNLYFTANNGSTGFELWVLDKHTANLVQLTDIINPGSASSSPSDIYQVDNTVYFLASSSGGYYNRQLWAFLVNPESVNISPVASNDSITTNENTPIIISAATLLANDTDADGDTLSITTITQPTNGSLIDNNNGTYTYTPNQNYSGTDSFTYSISDGQGGNNTATVYLTINNVITGTSASETLNGTASNDIIDGLDGNDKLYGKLGNDTLRGGTGNDWLDGGTGADEMIGGSGNDIYFVDDSGDTIVEEANGGTDAVISTISWELGNHLENLTLTGSNTINGTGNSGNNVLIGNSAANVLSGGSGNDWLVGGAGNDSLLGGTDNDTLYGGTGNDSLNGGAGADEMIGGSGNDTYYVDDSGDAIIEDANGGTDTVSVNFSWELGNYLENLTLTGNNAINGTGNDGNNVLIGNSAANVLSGNNGNDWLSGLGGNDRLLGDNGNDTLHGNDGDDTLIGGRGSDSLTGGAGKDSFQLSRPVGSDFDTITDFNVADDKIIISKAEFGLSQGVGVLDASVFRLGTSATTASDRFIYDQSTGNLFFDADGNGSAAQVRIAQLSNKPALANTNITVAEIAPPTTQFKTFTFYSPGIYPFGLNYFTGEDTDDNGFIDESELSTFYFDSRRYWGYVYDLNDVRSFRYQLGSNSVSWKIAGSGKPTLFGFGGLVAEYQLPAPIQHNIGTSASETLNGTASNDIIDGLDGNDKLYGELGNDTLRGGTGADEMIGGS
ncbi:cadherin-like domain-containing protein, partial [Anabaena sp. 4-3]